MNIVKFQDIIIEGNDLFNKNFKGKYVYAVNWHWCIPFDVITEEEYIAYSQSNAGIDVDYPDDYIIYSDYIDYVDVEATEKANSIVKYNFANSFTPDDDITIDELKKFRTWVAQNLLNSSAEFESDTVIMLNYYASGMTDTAIINMSYFPTTITTSAGISSISTTACSCNKTSNIYLSNGLAVCDDIAIYRRGIYEKMVSTFRDTYFWYDLDDNDFIAEMKKYIDNIIKVGLPLYQSQYDMDIYDCGCLSESDSIQRSMTLILNNLSQSLQYIIDDEISGHNNFIADSLYKWSSLLYEQMEW